MILTAPILRFYDPKKPVTLSVDASSTGVGCVILQDNQPVAYASSSLNESQKQWAQIEKEMLAIWFACSKFHCYIYGQAVGVETDHKLLVSILKKNFL